jgi:hypothetical protein
VTDTAREYVVPEYVIDETGWLVIDGGVFTVTLTDELVTLAPVVDTTT